jgi:dihydropteroate synthase
VSAQLERGFLEPGGRTRVMGIVNVTPDSFSDGGRFASSQEAIAHGLSLLADGADILDIGGESTRPGATRPLVDEELGRVIPVIRELAQAGAVVSVDTMRADVADAAVTAGASIVNDVSGGLADPRMLSAVAASGAAYIAMHWRAHSDHMQDFAVYDGPGGVVAAVRDELSARLEAAVSAGMARDRIVLDPGLGFAKNAEHNWSLLGHLDALQALGQPLLVGSSRKRFLGELLAGADGTDRPVDQREHANTALTVLLARTGVWGVRVHDVRASTDALAVLDRLAGS